MTLNLTMPGQDDLKPRITVFGVGGAGGNAVNNMIDKALEGVEFVVANTDAQALAQSKSQARIQMGVKVTEGLGAGARATVGAAAAEESIEQIVDHLAGAHMCFITAGMGGGTGTGAAPIIAQAARELGVLTVGVVTKPFQFEGAKRMRQAEDGVDALQKMVDTLIIIPNQNLFRLANEKTTFTEAFSMADDVLYQGVKGVTDLMVRPGLINLDFADVRAVMDEMGKAMMGTGEAEGDDRAIQAAEKAIANPLLDEISLKGARGVLINITGGYDLTLFELDEAANRIREEVDPDANIIVGSTLDTDMEGQMRVSVVATGIDATESHADIPLPRRSLAEPLHSPAEVEHSFGHDAPSFQHGQPETAADQGYEQDYSSEYSTDGNEPQASFFDEEIDPTAAAAEEQVENIFPAEEAGDDVPAPVFQSSQRAEPAPQPAPQPRPQARPQEGVSQFVAPKSPQPGQPSADTLARLEAAVTRSRSGEGRAAPQPPQGGGGDRPRFGINSLINRMTGGAEQASQQEPRYEPQARPAREPEQQADPDQERVEIPAFLRRQAN